MKKFKEEINCDMIGAYSSFIFNSGEEERIKRTKNFVNQ